MQLRPIWQRLDGARRAPARSHRRWPCSPPTIAARFAWVMVYNALMRCAASRARAAMAAQARRRRAGSSCVAWAGMRGIVTLAAAFAMPRDPARRRAVPAPRPDPAVRLRGRARHAGAAGADAGAADPPRRPARRRRGAARGPPRPHRGLPGAARGHRGRRFARRPSCCARSTAQVDRGQRGAGRRRAGRRRARRRAAAARDRGRAPARVRAAARRRRSATTPIACWCRSSTGRSSARAARGPPDQSGRDQTATSLISTR